MLIDIKIDEATAERLVNEGWGHWAADPINGTRMLQFDLGELINRFTTAENSIESHEERVGDLESD